MTAQVRAWVESRVKAILEAGYGKQLAARWPADLPTLKASSSHDDAQLDTIAGLCAQVEAASSMPFSDPDPRTAPEPWTPIDVTGASHTPPVAHAPADDVDNVVFALNQLPADVLQVVVGECKKAGVPNLGSGRATEDHLRTVLDCIQTHTAKAS